VLLVDEPLQVAGAQPLAGQVVEPDRHPGGGEVGERVAHGFLLRFRWWYP
jgi:hypothetical protein